MTLIYRISVDAVNRISVYSACDIPSMGDSNDRLKEARIKAGFTSARSAALRFGWNPSTYASHENGQTEVPTKAAAKYALNCWHSSLAHRALVFRGQACDSEAVIATVKQLAVEKLNAVGGAQYLLRKGGSKRI